MKHKQQPTTSCVTIIPAVGSFANRAGTGGDLGGGNSSLSSLALSVGIGGEGGCCTTARVGIGGDWGGGWEYLPSLDWMLGEGGWKDSVSQC